MSQGNWGGGGQGGGWGGQGGGGGGYGQPPGGGGYGQPPGGGGYGPPPGGGGYGPPPGGGGYGQPPGGGGYGQPPGGQPPGGYGPPGGQPPGGYGPPGGQPPGGYGQPPGYGAPPMGAPGALGMRAQFHGEGGTLLGTFLLYLTAPIVGLVVVAGALAGAGGAIAQATRTPELGMIFVGIAVILFYAGLLILPTFFQNKFLEFYFEKLVLDGQPCKYTGTLGGLFKVQFVNRLLIGLTFGIYTPWAYCKLKQWTYENVEVGGQRGRLTFHGDGGSLLGTWLLGSILMMCTAGIYGAWFANDLFAFQWDNTKIDGRNFTFKKDPGGFLGTMILTALLSYCTLFIYYPWGICNIFKWEAERVT